MSLPPPSALSGSKNTSGAPKRVRVPAKLSETIGSSSAPARTHSCAASSARAALQKEPQTAKPSRTPVRSVICGAPFPFRQNLQHGLRHDLAGGFRHGFPRQRQRMDHADALRRCGFKVNPG